MLRSLAQTIANLSRWDELRTLGNSRLVRLTVLIPIIGYMILFNDKLTEYLEFSGANFRDVFIVSLTNADTLSLSVAYRLYCFYFGFTFLAAASIAYAIACPSIVKAYGSAAAFYETERQIMDERRLQRMLYDIIRETDKFPELEKMCRNLGIASYDIWKSDLPQLREKYPGQSQGISDVKSGMEFLRLEMLEDVDDPPTWIMTNWFVPQKRARPRWRVLTLAMYFLGFSILAVPTLHSFLSVCWTVYLRLTE
jgi:hypothetical protein